MDIFSRKYKWAQLRCAMAAIVLQAILWQIFLPLSKYDWWGVIFYILATTVVIYKFFYCSLVCLYEKKAWKWYFVLRKYDISGVWYHEFRDFQDKNYVRIGKTIIEQDALKLHINATNYDEDFDVSKRTIWNNTSSYIGENNKLIISYEAHVSTYQSREEKNTLEEESIQKEKNFLSPEKTGLMYIQIPSIGQEKATVLQGTFHDSCPPFRRGTITLWRDATWKIKIESLETIGGEPSNK